MSPYFSLRYTRPPRLTIATPPLPFFPRKNTPPKSLNKERKEKKRKLAVKAMLEEDDE
jgi:hypothetical protein